MTITEINGFVLLPDPIDWSTPPQWSRAWQTGVTTAVTGAERRQGVRNLGRESLSYSIFATSLEARAELDARLDAANKSGQACAPFWGRGSVLADAVDGTSVTLTDAVWTFAPGDYVFLEDPFGNYEPAQIASIDPIVLSADVGRTYPAGSLLWPLFFGKFTMQKQNAITSWHGEVRVTIAELTARRQAVIGTPPSGTGTGIGAMVVGSTFDIG